MTTPPMRRALTAALVACAALLPLTACSATTEPAAPTASAAADPSTPTEEDDFECDADCIATTEALDLATPRGDLSALAITKREENVVSFAHNPDSGIDTATVPDGEIIRGSQIVCDALDDRATSEGALIELKVRTKIDSPNAAPIVFAAVNLLCTEHLPLFADLAG